MIFKHGQKVRINYHAFDDGDTALAYWEDFANEVFTVHSLRTVKFFTTDLSFARVKYDEVDWMDIPVLYLMAA